MSYVINYRQGPPLPRWKLFAVLAGLYTAAMLLCSPVPAGSFHPTI